MNINTLTDLVFDLLMHFRGESWLTYLMNIYVLGVKYEIRARSRIRSMYVARDSHAIW